MTIYSLVHILDGVLIDNTVSLNTEGIIYYIKTCFDLPDLVNVKEANLIDIIKYCDDCRTGENENLHLTIKYFD